MAFHFISVLGTSNYEPVSYDGKDVTSFVQIALLQKFHDKLSDGDSKITFFLTKKAKEDNWENREYSEKERERMNNWPESIRPVSEQKEGLSSQIKRKFPDLAEHVETVDIPEGKNETEIWSIFQNIYQCLRKKDQIIFDITHSFRSIPMLAIAAINYAGVMKDCSLNGIYYGAYEASTKDPLTGIKQASVFDLTVYNEILSWTHAADTLKKYGDPREITDVVKNPEKMRYMNKAERKEWGPITNHVTAMKTMTEALFACRGASPDVVEGRKAASSSIMKAYSDVKKTRDEIKEKPKNSEKIFPLYELLNEAESSFSDFDVKENYQAGLAAIEWYIKNGMIQQGYTALEETTKTFLCSYYGLDGMNRDNREGIVGDAMKAMARYMEKMGLTAENAEKLDREQVWRCIYNDIFDASEHERKTENQWKKIELIIETLPFAYAKNIHEIGDTRNDINHFGMRAKPLSADKLKKKLSEEFEKLKVEINEMQEQAHE